jgi:hypothetical protein
VATEQQPVERQLEWEARAGRPTAIAAFASALLSIGGTVYYQAVALADTDDNVDFLQELDESSADFIVAAAIQAVGILLLAVVLTYLYRATSFRRPETPRVALVLGVAGPLVVALLQVVQNVLYVDAAGDILAEHAPLHDERADELFDDERTSGALATIGGVGIGAGLALAFSFVLVNLNAMRAGLVSRFMGIIGIILGVLYVLPQLGPPAIIQLFWLTALGFLFLGRWPGGRGPAWETGEAVPWPTAAERQRAARGEEEPETEPLDEEEEAEADEEAEPAAAQHPRSKKRKRRR